MTEGRAKDFEFFTISSSEPVDHQIFVVSDFTGETASSTTRAALRQFTGDNVALRRFRNVRDPEQIVKICDLAKAQKAMVVATLVAQSMRERMTLEATARSLVFVDLVGPLLDGISSTIGQAPMGQPGSDHNLDEEYFRRVKAIEYSSTCDDGSNPALLPEADLVIVGVSRTCKTPLSMYLANKGLRTANVPLVPELDPPEELFRVTPGRVIGLVIAPEALMKIRRDRLVMLGLDPQRASYAQMERVSLELSYARHVMERLGAYVVDVTGRALEETAQEILEYFRTREEELASASGDRAGRKVSPA